MARARAEMLRVSRYQASRRMPPARQKNCPTQYTATAGASRGSYLRKVADGPSSWCAKRSRRSEGGSQSGPFRKHFTLSPSRSQAAAFWSSSPK